MADQDEDIAHLRAPDATDDDSDEETQGFGLVKKLMCVISHAQPALFFCPAMLMPARQSTRSGTSQTAKARREGLREPCDE